MSAGTSWLLLLSLHAQPPAAPGPPVVRVAPRVPALAVVVTPFGRASGLGTTALIDALALALETRTDLVVRSAEQAGVDQVRLRACPSERRLTCWARTARRDLDTTDAPTGDAPRHLFVISAGRLADGRDRVSVTWMDLEGVAEQLGARPNEPAEAREDRLFASALHSPPLAVDAAGLQDGFHDLVTTRMQARLRAAGRWGALGAIALEHSCDGCLLVVDERPVGAVAAGPVQLADLPPGPHQVVLSRGGRPAGACARTATVPLGGAATLDLTACEAVSAGAGVRSAVRWTGVAMLVTGAVFGAVGIQRAAAGPQTVCVRRDGDCDGLGLPTLAFDPGGGPATERSDVNPSGPSWAGLGGGVATAGGAMVAGSYLTDDERWWWSPIAAAVLGGAAYAAIAAAGAR